MDDGYFIRGLAVEKMECLGDNNRTVADEDMQIRIRHYRLPGWLVPLMVLLALAMIPVTIALALGILAVALGMGVAGALRPPSGRTHAGRGRVADPGSLPGLNGEHPEGRPSPAGGGADRPVIDVEYEAKDSDEKG